MAYIPEDAKWYLADIVEVITVEGDPRNVVHTNLTLIRADSPEDAYRKAIELGTSADRSYRNPAGKLVTFRFAGLGDLNVVHEDFEHGAELIFSEDVDVDAATIDSWVSSKEDLAVFREAAPNPGPDYRAADLVEELYERMRHPKSGGGPETIH